MLPTLGPARRCALSLALIFSALAAQYAAARDIKAVPELVDADTVYAGAVKIRLAGIDAPETDQICLDANGQSWTCGVQAKQRLESFSRNRPWLCRLTGPDAYGRLTLTLLLIVFFMIEGISKVIFSLTIRPFPNWGWVLASGIVGILLALYIWANVPVTAIWVLGVLLGIQLICEGAALGYLAWQVRQS